MDDFKSLISKIHFSIECLSFLSDFLKSFLLKETCRLSGFFIWGKALLVLMTFSISSTCRKASSLHNWGKCAILFSSWFVFCYFCLFVSLFSSLDHLEFFQRVKMKDSSKVLVTFLTLRLLSTLWFCFPFFISSLLLVRITFSKWFPWSCFKTQILSNAIDWFSVHNVYFNVLVRDIHYHYF